MIDIEHLLKNHVQWNNNMLDFIFHGFEFCAILFPPTLFSFNDIMIHYKFKISFQFTYYI